MKGDIEAERTRYLSSTLRGVGVCSLESLFAAIAFDELVWCKFWILPTLFRKLSMFFFLWSWSSKTVKLR